MRLPFGLGIERDLTFATTVPLSVWAEVARRTGSLIDAEARLLRAATGGGATEFPPADDQTEFPPAG